MSAGGGSEPTAPHPGPGRRSSSRGADAGPALLAGELAPGAIRTLPE
jgi:hypothetical protein